MKLKIQTFNGLFLLALLGNCVLAPRVMANPQEELTPDQPLYQRVRNLEKYGLLDPQDQAVLDQGKIVTRLELAFYTEKAKARLAAPPVIEATATPPPAPLAPPIAPPPVMPPPAPITPPVITPAVSAEVDKLLKEFKEEVAQLRDRLITDDQRLKDREKELDALQPIQDEVSEIFKNANKQTGSTSINSVSRFHFEDIGFSGVGGTPSGVQNPPAAVGQPTFLQGALPSANAVRAFNETNIQMITDLGGHGSFSLGLGEVLSDSNVSANGLEGTGPVSLYIFNPDFSLLMNGPLGQWNTHVMVEGYPGALTLGDFSRGVAPIFIERFEDPFDIKHFTDDKDMKNWDDYMTNIAAPAPNPASGTIGSTYDSVFDGIYGVGNSLPLLGGDARLVLLVGRMGTSNLQSQRWEEGAKLDGSIFDFLRGDLATEWVNDHFADSIGPEMDMQSYQNEYFANFNPVTISLEGGLSSLYTGEIASLNPQSYGVSQSPQTSALIGFAGQASISLYPLTLYYFGIDPNYSNFQSKVAMAGVNFYKYGEVFSPSNYDDVYGWVGEVDNLVSDRYGYRFNLGWNGRQQDWMKSWPAFLDNLVVNFDYSQKHEYVAEYSPGAGNTPNGYNVIEVLNETTLYYGDDEGLWGLNFWGGYGPGGEGNPWFTTRQDYINNIEAIRDDDDLSFDDVRYKSNMSSERIPLIIPGTAVVSNGVTTIEPLPPGDKPTVDPANGLNEYYVLPDLKTYNYVTLTTKYQFNKLWGSTTPLYGSFYFTDNTVSGQSNNPSTPSLYQNIPNLLNQTVCDVAGMYQVFRNVNFMIDRGWEIWTCNYTYPLVNYRYDSFGLGFAYDFPWGGGKWEFRYKHYTFKDQYVPDNDYTADQFFSTMSFLF